VLDVDGFDYCNPDHMLIYCQLLDAERLERHLRTQEHDLDKSMKETHGNSDSDDPDNSEEQWAAACDEYFDNVTHGNNLEANITYYLGGVDKLQDENSDEDLDKCVPKRRRKSSANFKPISNPDFDVLSLLRLHPIDNTVGKQA